SEYLSYGFTYNGDRFNVDFLGSNAETETISLTNFAGVNFDVPGLKISLEPGSSTPTFTFADGYSPADASAVSSYQINFRPSQAANSEDQYKIDVDYRTDWSFLTGI